MSDNGFPLTGCVHSSTKNVFFTLYFPSEASRTLSVLEPRGCCFTWKSRRRCRWWSWPGPRFVSSPPSELGPAHRGPSLCAHRHTDTDQHRHTTQIQTWWTGDRSGKLRFDWPLGVFRATGASQHGDERWGQPGWGSWTPGPLSSHQTLGSLQTSQRHNVTDTNVAVLLSRKQAGCHGGEKNWRRAVFSWK